MKHNIRRSLIPNNLGRVTVFRNQTFYHTAQARLLKPRLTLITMKYEHKSSAHYNHTSLPLIRQPSCFQDGGTRSRVGVVNRGE